MPQNLITGQEIAPQQRPPTNLLTGKPIEPEQRSTLADITETISRGLIEGIPVIGRWSVALSGWKAHCRKASA